jgi:hypothetical protein
MVVAQPQQTFFASQGLIRIFKPYILFKESSARPGTQIKDVLTQRSSVRQKKFDLIFQFFHFSLRGAGSTLSPSLLPARRAYRPEGKLYEQEAGL